MNKETVARQQITIADIRDGEKGAKGDTGARGANGSNGAAAEFYRLQPRTEKAIVASDNVLRVNLEYTIEHVKGAQISVETGAAQGYHLIAWTNQGVFLTMTAGRVNSGTYQMENYSKTGDRPDFINIELRDNANKTLDRRTVQITMEAASFVNVIGDVRETVSQNGKDITTIQQDARGIRLQVESLKSGARNLIKGGMLNVTSSHYGIPLSPLKVKLKPETDYTLTVNGHVSTRAAELDQVLRTFVFNSNWSWASSCGIKDTTDATVSMTFRIPADNAATDGIYQVHSYPYPNQNDGALNGEVTVNWITLTEGTQPEKAWIPAEGEDVYTQMSKAGMEIKDGEITLTADRTKIRNNKGEDIAVFNEDGTVDARRILMRCRFGNITFGEVDGYPNIILANELGQPQIMLNHRGIVNKYGVDMKLINASRYFVSKRDGKAYLGVNIIVKITNRGFQQNTYGGGDIELTATLDDKSYEYITLQLGQQYTGGNKAIIAATTPITLKIGESGELLYGGLFEIGSTSGGAVVTQKISYSVRSVYYDTVVTKSYVSELGGNNFSSDSGGNLINPSNGDEPPAVIPAPNMNV
ncbi:hypothetical protein J5A68_06455 [Prevotella melaninogenica]|uniref:hypothetical protein n=1 Tax=Prevotella melaninogenica TaxID=28132 RepID=UPI001BA6AE00|nr:hypothetical protein [Prevotella melaninogenica]QUB67680.1 hypothetical protein J5A68_06455 [Prevotella melaninogenica]